MKFFKFDRKLFFLIIVLFIIGVIFVYSASWPYAQRLNYPSNYFERKQLRFGLIGIALMLVVSHIDYRVYKKMSLFIYLVCLGLLLLIFTPLSSDYGTFARRWLNIGPIAFMPSDLMKGGSVLLMASYLSQNKRYRTDFKKGFLVVLVIIGITVLPIYKQPNLSTTLVIALTLGTMYFLSGMKISHLLISLFAFGVSLIYFIFFSGNDYRKERVAAFLNPLKDFHDEGWQLSQALFAVSTGGIFGLGIGRSRQKYLYLSEAHNDFIFSIITEETGIVGAFIIIFLFLYFLKLGLQIARDAKTEFGRLLASGLTLVIVFQAAINIGVSFGAIPPTGLVLPFISYGGTSLIITFIMSGVLLNISKDRYRDGESK